VTGIIPFVDVSPIIDIFIFSVFLGLLITLLQKVLVNQGKAKEVKDRMEILNKEMKETKDDKEKYSRVMGDWMKENSNLMSMTMKPTLVLIVVFFFGVIPLMNSFYGDVETEFIDSKGMVELKGIEYSTEIQDGKLFVNGEECDTICEKNLEGKDWEIRHDKAGSFLFVFPTPEKVVFSQIVARLPIGLPLAGESVSWLGWYFLSLLSVIPLFRKAMKIAI
jgi:uncharacterized membrane protein (DUF106 family)